MDMVRVMVCNVTFNNISVISWQSVIVVEEARVPGQPPTIGKQVVNFIIRVYGIKYKIYHEQVLFLLNLLSLLQDFELDCP
jgi:hypothetical protein